MIFVTSGDTTDFAQASNPTSATAGESMKVNVERDSAVILLE